MARRLRLLLLALLAAGAVTPTTHASASPPLGIPIPNRLTTEDLLSTESESGDLRALFPGARACDSAPYRRISLPADDAPHNADTYIEWWYWTGHLVTSDGRQLGFMLDFASKPWADFQETEYAVTDLSTRTFHEDRQPIIVGRPAETSNRFELRGAHSSASGGNGRDRLHIEVDGYELDLSLEARKPPVIQLGDGHLSAFCNDTYLYSRVRMRTVGTLKQGGRSVRVRGTSNFDHTWGFNPATEITPWDWWTFQLDDGRDIFITVVRLRRNGEEATLHTGSISDARGRVTTLRRGDFEITPTRYWRRDASCRYPVEYDLRIKGLDIQVRPRLDSTEIRATRWPEYYVLWPAYPVMWDGPTVVTGDARGRGWLDMGRHCAY